MMNASIQNFKQCSNNQTVRENIFGKKVMNRVKYNRLDSSFPIHHVLSLCVLFYTSLFSANSFAGSTLVRETVTTTTYSQDGYGQVEQIQVVTTDHTALGAGDQYQTITNNTYYAADDANWFIDRLETTAVTQITPEYPNGETRQSAFEYNPGNGLLTKEIIEPNIPAMKLETSYEYDAYGNKKKVTVTGGAGNTYVASRDTFVNFGTNGQFPSITTNALGHSESTTHNPEWGNAATLTGPNNLTTTWNYDEFGRQKGEVRADGTETENTREWCDNFNGETGIACPTGGALAVVTTTVDSNNNQIAPTSIVYSDAYGREIRQETESFEGNNAIYVDTEYNDLGQVVAKSRPYFNGDGIYWNTVTYDVVGRAVESRQLDAGSEPDIVTTTEYIELTVKVTNDKGQVNQRVENAIGQLVRSIDDQSNIATYQYDAFGNLEILTDSTGNNQTINSYDIRGRKISMDDPDMGYWTYEYNAIGELISQTDAKSQTVTMAYDKLGRMTTRVEAEGTSTWRYDFPSNSNYQGGQNAKSIGKLVSLSGAEGKDESYLYDTYGRLSSATTTISGGTSHVQSQTYDNAGRVDVITYPQRFHDNGRFKVKHYYNSRGFLEYIYDADTPSQKYYEVISMNAEGQVTSEEYGNGVTTNRAYTGQTGLIRDIGTSSPLGTNNIQDLSFTFDSLGNLTQRDDLDQNNTETFVYDTLNRMTESTMNTTVKSYSYDSLGNITSKTGIGTYLYLGSRPHAVTSVGGHSVYYDANGNVTQNYNFTASQTRTITWSSYNKPFQIDQGTTNLTFKYGASREMFQQVTTVTGGNSEYRTYVNPVFEIDSKVGKTTYIHYIQAGGQTVGLFKSIDDIFGSNDSEETRYLHRDHLGSITEITDETAAVEESLSYDPHGKRRQPSWDDAVAQIFSSQLNRCFTGHQYLDDVGLIHMGGRVYDPDLGRFMSPDPFIQEPGNQQNFNRYSYVLNNPLSYTDPSGFIFDKLFDFIGDVVGAIGKAVKAVLGNEILRTIAAIAIAVYAPFGTGYLAAASKGFAAGFVASGGDIRAGLLGAATGLALHGIGSHFKKLYPDGVDPFSAAHGQKILAHGVVGGTASRIQGGKFLSGFVSAGTTQALAPGIDLLDSKNTGPNLQRTVAASIAGGTASVLGGGKFKNGAISGAFSRLFNDDSTKGGKKVISEIPSDKSERASYIRNLSRLTTALEKLENLLQSEGDQDALEIYDRATIYYEHTEASSSDGVHIGETNFDLGTITFYKTFGELNFASRQFNVFHEFRHLFPENAKLNLNRHYLTKPHGERPVEIDANEYAAGMMRKAFPGRFK